jgi:hypothetical protein
MLETLHRNFVEFNKGAIGAGWKARLFAATDAHCEVINY